MPLPWTSDLVAFVELRGRLRSTTVGEFASGAQERDEALAATERDYVALVSVGAKAARLQQELEAADRQATSHELDSAALVVRQMLELVERVAARVPPAER